MSKKNKSIDTVDYMGTQMPTSFFEKPTKGRKATTVMRGRQPTLQEQIAAMVRYHNERAEALDEDFSDGDDYSEGESQSPHELVRDEELGVEMTRYEKQMLDAARPQMELNARKEAERQFREKISRKTRSKNERPDPQRSEDQDSQAGEEDANGE